MFTPEFLVEVATYAIGSPKEAAYCNDIYNALRQDLISYRDHHCQMGSWKAYCLTYKGFEYINAMYHPKYLEAAKQIAMYNYNHSVEILGKDQVYAQCTNNS